MIRAEYEAEGDYIITVTPSDHGMIVVDKTNANFEDEINLTITPDEGYRLIDESLMFNSTLIDGTSFLMPDEDVVITSDFELNTQIPNTGDIVNMNTASTMLLLGFAFVSGSADKEKKNIIDLMIE